MAADDCRRDHTVRSGPNKFGLSLFFRSPRDDMKAGVQIASCQNHIDVISIVWQAGSKSTGVFYPGFAQASGQLRQAVQSGHVTPEIQATIAKVYDALVSGWSLGFLVGAFFLAGAAAVAGSLVKVSKEAAAKALKESAPAA